MALQSASPLLVLDVEIVEFQRALVRLADITGKNLGSVVKQNSRLIAWNLANNTQPYGMSLAEKKQGEAAVLRDVGRVYSSAAQTFKALEDNGHGDMAKAWYKLVKIGGYGQAEKLLKGTTLKDRNAPIFAPLDPGFHKKARNGSRGTVSRHRAAQIVPDSKQIREHAKTKKQLVGFGKAGWITAGSALGGIRQVPAWITRHRGTAPGTAADHSGRKDDPFVTMVNAVRYASKILPDFMVADALRMQREKMLAHIEHVILNSAKTAGFEAHATVPSSPPPAS